MVGHDGVGTQVNGKQGGQQPDAFLDPLAPVLVVFAGLIVPIAQKAPAHAAGDNVVVGCVGNGYEFLSGARHAIPLTVEVLSESNHCTLRFCKYGW